MFNKSKPYKSWLLYFLCGAVSLLILFSRRPDALLNPQFWAEDGKVWYQDVYNRGIIYSLFTPEAGYFQTISRLTAIFSQMFPLADAPLIFNLTAFLSKIIVVLFIISPRLSKIFPQLWTRILLAFVYLALPHSYETHANLTNVQWHLALLSCLILVSEPSRKMFWKIFDVLIISISALSGPFCLLLLPVAAVKYWKRRDNWTLTLSIILFFGCLIQGFSLLMSERPSHAPLGANIGLFLKILGGHLFLSSVVGENGYLWIMNHSLWKDGSAILINLIGLSFIIYAFLKVNFEIRLLILFSFLIVIGAFLSPAITNEKPQWQVMEWASVGSRYWLIPIFSLFACLIYLILNAKIPAVRYVFLALLLFSSVGIAWDWKYPPFENYNFPAYAEKFEKAERGQEIVIPINPNWEMRLVKK